MEKIDYSVIIRTTGKAGAKYAKLLESIDGLIPRPREVIVVLPEGFDLPPERLGWETFCFCPKGMVTQRLYGIQMCQTPYALISDDDIAFGRDFVQQLYQPLKDGYYGLSAGPLLEFFPKKGIQALFWALGAAAIPAHSHKARYTTMLCSTGYVYNRNIDLKNTRIYEAHSAAWTCFFADIAKLRSIRMEDELWLDHLGYSAHDDTVMFYKAWLRGIKTAIVSTATYQHLDGKTSTQGRPVQVKRAMGFTRYVLWHRFFYEQARGLKKPWCVVCIAYRTLFQVGTDLIRFFAGKRPFAEVKAYIDGTIQAMTWVMTSEYQTLPPLVERN
jgi:hypothetical protein